MLGSSTDINIHRLITHMDLASSGNLRLMVSLDAKNAFDLVEWEYLWAVFQKFGFGLNFIAWYKMVYFALVAQVQTNGND